MTLFLGRGLKELFGNGISPITTSIIYIVSGCIMGASKEILRNIQLQTDEYNRLTTLLKEQIKQNEEYLKKLTTYINLIKEQTKHNFDQFIHSFSYNMENGENYDVAINSIVRFADEMGIELHYVKFDDFANAITENKTFKL